MATPLPIDDRWQAHLLFETLGAERSAGPGRKFLCKTACRGDLVEQAPGDGPSSWPCLKRARRRPVPRHRRASLDQFRRLVRGVHHQPVMRQSVETPTRSVIAGTSRSRSAPSFRRLAPRQAGAAALTRAAERPMIRRRLVEVGIGHDDAVVLCPAIARRAASTAPIDIMRDIRKTDEADCRDPDDRGSRRPFQSPWTTCRMPSGAPAPINSARRTGTWVARTRMKAAAIAMPNIHIRIIAEVERRDPGNPDDWRAE